MPNRENLEKIRKIIKEFFEKLTFEVEEIEAFLEAETLQVSLECPEPQILIGQNGETLNDLQRLLGAILRRQLKEDFYVSLDVNDYRAKKGEYLKEMAREAADLVSLTKKEKSLPPMSASERRVVHLELSQREDVTTESVGEGAGRQIVVKPKPIV